MKKLIQFSVPFKAFASMLFAGIITLYMVSSFLYTVITGEELSYSVPFIFILQGMGLSVLISLLWSLFYSNIVIKKWRLYIRHILFELSILALFAVCFFSFSSISTVWTKLWLAAVAAVSVFVIILFGICEMYFKKTGKRYTEILKSYQSQNF